MSNLTIINCAKLNTCEKIKIILDKDLFSTQYRDAIILVCSKCNEKVEEK